LFVATSIVKRKYAIHCIAIIDGDEFERPIPYWDVQIAGYKIIHIPNTLRTKAEIIEAVQGCAQAVICSHRLWKNDPTAPSGAEIVASLYNLKIPALLVTQYKFIDTYSTLAEWKRKVPLILHPREFDIESLHTHFAFCIAELHGPIPQERVPYQVVLYIANVEEAAGEKYIDATVDIWDHYQIIRFPLSLVPERLRHLVVPDGYLFAIVNAKAASADDLYFCNFESCPRPEFEENLSHRINMIDGSGTDAFKESAELKAAVDRELVEPGQDYSSRA
jgi:hypothetical protein